MARMHAPRDPFSKGDDEGHDKPKYNCTLAKDESAAGLLPFTIPMDYKSIIGNSILGIIVACVAISAFALLKHYGWKAWKEIPTIETSGVKFYFKLLKVLVLFLTLGSGVPAIILMIVNLFGDHYGSKSGNKWFQATTIVNLSESNVLYLHYTLGFISYLFLSALMVKFRCDVMAESKDDHPKENLTLFVENLPIKDDKLDDDSELYDFTNHLDQEKFESELFQLISKDSIKSVVPVRKYGEKYVKLMVALKNAEEALQYATENPDTRMFTKFWGQSSQMAKEYYENLIKDLEKEIETEKEENQKFYLMDKAFIKFNDLEGAKKFYESQRNAKKFKASYAPHPENINWENLSLTRNEIFLRQIFMFFCVSFMAVVVSTPQNAATHTVEFLQKHGIGLKSLFAFLVIIFATLLPSLASMSSRWIGFYTKSREEKGTMKSTILFLLFMVIIMPVLGFTFGPDLFEFLVGNLENEFKDDTRWLCLFLPNSGAYFTIYVIIVTFIGNSLELLKIPLRILYGLRCAMAKSRAEFGSIKKNTFGKFYFGESYATIILIFTMTIMFSFSFPLINIPGFIFMIVKFFVDRHNIRYFHEESSIDSSVHLAATHYFVFASFLQLIALLLFAIIESEKGHIACASVYLILAFIIPIIIDRIEPKVSRIEVEEEEEGNLEKLQNLCYYPPEAEYESDNSEQED